MDNTPPLIVKTIQQVVSEARAMFLRGSSREQCVRHIYRLLNCTLDQANNLFKTYDVHNPKARQ